MSEYKLPTNELLKLIELSQKATPGKFQWVTEPGKHAIITALQDNAPVIGVAIVNEKLNDKNGKQKKADAAFIVTACNSAADMAREIIKARGAIKAALDYLYSIDDEVSAPSELFEKLEQLPKETEASNE